jgi:hypothetical protein
VPVRIDGHDRTVRSVVRGHVSCGGYGARSVGKPKSGRTSRTGTTAARPKRRPRHLEPPRQPWRLTLFAFGLTASVLAALVASAALVPHDPAPPTPGRPPGGALSTFPVEPAPTAASTTTTRPRQASTSRAPSTTRPDTATLAASRPTATTRPATTWASATVGRTTTTRALTTLGATTTLPTVTAPTTTVEPTTTLPTTTTTEPPTTTTEPATTTTGQSVLRGDQVASVSAATAAVLLPILGLLYLLGGLLPQPGGRHARRRRGANHLRRRG